jgi:hypothetical protein
LLAVARGGASASQNVYAGLSHSVETALAVQCDPTSFLTEWHRIVAARDFVALPGVLLPTVSMGAPPYWQKIAGRDPVAHLLGIIITTIEDFRYHREWVEGAELALEFSGHVGSLDLQGIDLITLDHDNRIANLDVLMRPINAVAKLQEIVAPQMMEFLSARAGEG